MHLSIIRVSSLSLCSRSYCLYLVVLSCRVSCHQHVPAQQQEAQKRIKTQTCHCLFFNTTMNTKPAGAFRVEAAAMGMCISRCRTWSSSDWDGCHWSWWEPTHHPGQCWRKGRQGQKCLQCSRSQAAGIPAFSFKNKDNKSYKTTKWLLLHVSRTASMQKLFSQSSNTTCKSVSVSVFHKTTCLNLAPASPRAQPQRGDGGQHNEHCSAMLPLGVPPSISAQEDIRQGQAAHPRPTPYYPFASGILHLTIWMRRRIVGWGTCSTQTILGGQPESKCLSSKSQFSLTF